MAGRGPGRRRSTPRPTATSTASTSTGSRSSSPSSTQRLRARARATLLEKIADGDWSDETQKELEEAVEYFAERLRLRPRRGGPARSRRATSRRRAQAPGVLERRARRRRRRRRRATPSDEDEDARGGRRRAHEPARRQEPDPLGQEHPARSRGRWRWSPPRACAGPSSASRRCGPTPTAIRRMTRQAAEAAGGHAARCRSSSEHDSEDTVALLLVTGDRGLAGAFNSQIIRAGMRAGNEHEGEGRTSSATPRAAAASPR